MNAPQHSSTEQPAWTPTTCLCGQAVIVVLLNMRTRQVDYDPSDAGDIQLRPNGTPGGPPIASRLAVAKRFGKRDLRRTHQCPDARLVRTGPRII